MSCTQACFIDHQKSGRHSAICGSLSVMALRAFVLLDEECDMCSCDHSPAGAGVGVLLRILAERDRDVFQACVLCVGGAARN